MSGRLKKILKNPKIILIRIMNSKLFRFVPDDKYIKIMHFLKTSKRINLKNPRTFNEKIQWLKLNDRNPAYSEMVDKVAVRDLIGDKIGQKYLIPAIGVYDQAEAIDFSDLPEQFVLKANHTSGNVYVCDDKSELNENLVKKRMRDWLNRNYYWVHREYPYKKVKPKILVEQYLVDESKTQLKDYKIMCFNGEPKIVQVMSDRSNGHYYVDHYDLDWNPVEIRRKKIQRNPQKIAKPDKLNEMIEISRKLSKGLPFARIDLYNTENSVYFGEITLYPLSGYMNFEDKETNLLLGSWIDLEDAYSYKTTE